MFDLAFFAFYGFGSILAGCLMAWWIADRRKIGESVIPKWPCLGGELCVFFLVLIWPIAIIGIFVEVLLKSAAREGGPMRRVRRACFSLTLFLAIFFAVAIVATWISDEFFKRQSAAYIAETIQPAVNQGVDILERPPHKVSSFKQRIIKVDDTPQVKRELVEYSQDPVRYIQALIVNPPDRKLSHEVEATDRWKQMVFGHFNEAYWKLILDVRVFAFTNMVGFLFVSFLIADRSHLRLKVTPPAVILGAAVLFSIWAFFDSVTFFTILSGWNMAAFHPVMLLVLFGLGIIYSRKWKRERRLQSPL